MNWIKRLFSLPRVRREDPSPRTIYVPLMQAGVRVDHETALKYSAVYSAVRVIAETVCLLPWRSMRRRPDGTREHLTGSAVEQVLNRRPNPEMAAFAFRETLVAWALTWGNGYAEIVRDNAGRIAELWPIAPDRVEVNRDQNGNLVYEISNAREGNISLRPEDMFHLHGLGFDGRVGYSVISLMAQSVGLGLATETFGASFFGNNTVLGGILEHPGKLTDAAFEHLKKSWQEKHQGPAKAFAPQILEEGMKWHSIGIPPGDAQFLETRKLQVQEIARWYRVPPHKIGDLDRATFTNIEHQSREFVTDAILPWTVRLEQEADFKLLRNNPSQYTKFNLNAMLRGDSQARGELYTKLWSMGVLSVNEIREKEDMDPIGPDGDKRLVQLNLTTLKKVGEEKQQTPILQNPDEDEEQEQNVRAAHKKLIETTLNRIIQKEQSRASAASEKHSAADFVNWSSGFFGGSMPEYIKEMVLPACSAYASTVGASRGVVDTIVTLYSGRHIEESRQAFGVFYETGEWQDERASENADRLIEDISNAALLEVA